MDSLGDRPRADWTVEQAKAANEHYLLSHATGPEEPIYQWHALQVIERERAAMPIGHDLDE
jgi:hypothetical protein